MARTWGIRWALAGRRLAVAWTVVGLLLLALAQGLWALGDRFQWERELAAIPALELAGGMVAAGLLFLCIGPLVGETLARNDADLERRLLALVLGVGLTLRLMMLPLEPALEDDQQRYLWEGALVAHGHSPYAIAPEDAKSADRGTPLGQLAEQAGPVLDRVNHPHLKTIYPPVALGLFGLAHRLAPFSLTAWRLILLVAEAGSLVLLLALLRAGGQAPLWVALYWWNPLAIKEIVNSGHMEGVLIPMLLAAVLLAIRRRPLLAAGALGLAVGVKIWPILLAPLLLRPWLGAWRTLAGALAVLGAICLLSVLPIVAGGLDQRSGFIAYAREWQAVSALLPALRDGLAGLLGASTAVTGPIVRAALAGIVAAVAIWQAWRSDGSPRGTVRAAATTTLALVLLSPAQFPWYMLWTMPFLPFAPRAGVALMAALLPLYYVSFYLSAHDAYHLFRDRVVWGIWLPIWAVLAVEGLAGRARRPRDNPT